MVESSTKKQLKEQIEGLLVGIAIGESLGMSVRGMSYNRIVKKYGEGKVRTLQPFGPEGQPDQFKAGSLGPNSQMMMATTEGILGTVGQSPDRIIENVFLNFKRWLEFQSSYPNERGADQTTLEVLRETELSMFREHFKNGVVPNMDEESGCLLRVMPIGLLYDEELSFYLGYMTTRITHGDVEIGLMSGMLASIVSSVARGREFGDALYLALMEMREYPDHEKVEDEMVKVLDAYLKHGKRPLVIANNRAKRQISDFDSTLGIALTWVLNSLDTTPSTPEGFMSDVSTSVSPLGESHVIGGIVAGLLLSLIHI